MQQHLNFLSNDYGHWENELHYVTKACCQMLCYVFFCLRAAPHFRHIFTIFISEAVSNVLYQSHLKASIFNLTSVGEHIGVEET